MVSLREAHFSSTMQLVSGWACVALRYLWGRSFETLLYTNMVDFVGMALLFGAELYSICVHMLGLFVNVWPIERPPAEMPANRADWPTVDIFIPTYSEDPEIV